MGLGDVRWGLTSEGMSASGSVVVGRSAWGSGLVGSMVEVTCPITSPSLSDCCVKVDMMCANNQGGVLLAV